MGEDAATTTLRALHGVAELLVAGPQYRATGTLRLAVRPGGFGTSRGWDDVAGIAVDGTDLVVTGADGQRRIPLAGTCAELAAAAGLAPGGLEGAYAGGSGVRPGDPVEVDPAAAARFAAAWATGDAALRRLGGADAPVLWPEHFDVAVTLDEVNYGVSPGDSAISEPYAYVGPYRPRTGDFWNQPFGAARTLRELGGEAAVLDFFRAGQRLAAAS